MNAVPLLGTFRHSASSVQIIHGKVCKSVAFGMHLASWFPVSLSFSLQETLQMHHDHTLRFCPPMTNLYT